jgi:hypothetical protein
LKKLVGYTSTTQQSVLPLTEEEDLMAQPKREEDMPLNDEIEADEARSKPRTLGDLDALLAGDDDDGDEDGDWDEFDEDEEDEDDIPVGPAASLRRLGGGRFGSRFGRHPQIAQQVPMLQGDIVRSGKAKQLIVQERTREGEIHEWGRLPADASIEAMINLTGKAGHFLVMPIDETGRELLNEPKIKSVAPGHRYLRDMLAEMNPAGGGGARVSVGGLASSEYLSLFKELREEGMTAAEAARLEAAAARERAERDREAIWQERSSLNQTRMEMTAGMTTDFAEMQSQAHERELARQQAMEARREREHQENLARERAAVDERMKAGDRQHMTMMQFMQLQMQQERERSRREREEAAVRRAEERRRDDARAAEDRRRQEMWVQQQQQFMLMQMQTQTQLMQREFTGKENLFNMKQQLMAAAKTDADPLTQMQKMMTLMAAMREMMPEERAGMFEKLMEMAGAVVPAMMGSVAPGAPMLTETPPPPPAPEATPMLPVYNPDDMSITMPPDAASGPQPIPVPGSEMANSGYPPGYEPPQPVVIPADASSHAAPAAEPTDAPWAVSAWAPAINSVPADVRNKARRILRNAAAATSQADQTQLGAVVLAQLMTDMPAMQQYLRVIPLHRALIEAGVAVPLADAVIAQLVEQGVPTTHNIVLR